MVTLVDDLVFWVIWSLMDVACVVQDDFHFSTSRSGSPPDVRELHQSWSSIERSHSSKPLPSRVFDLAITSFLAVFVVWYTSKLCSTTLSANIFFIRLHHMSVCRYTCDGHFRIKQGIKTSVKTNTFHCDTTAWFSHLNQLKPSYQFSLGMHQSVGTIFGTIAWRLTAFISNENNTLL